MLSDYANLVYGLLDLFLVTQETRWLKDSIEIHEKMVNLFEDEENGGFFNTLEDESDLIVRTKSGTDNAVPSGNSIAALNALRLSSITGNLELEKQAERTLLAFGDSLKNQAMAYPMMLNALYYLEKGGEELLLVPANGQTLDRFIDPLRETFLPCLVWMDATDATVRKLNPLAEERTAVDDHPTAYLCRNRTCQQPITNPMEIVEALK